MRRVVLLLTVLLMGFAPAPVYKPKPEGRTAIERLQGEWSRLSMSINGGPLSDSGGVTLTVKGNLMGFGSADDEWKVTIDAAKAPARIDFHRVKLSGNIDVLLGIYRLEADKLTICWCLSKEEGERPTNFDPKKSNWLHVYSRKKS